MFAMDRMGLDFCIRMKIKPRAKTDTADDFEVTPAGGRALVTKTGEVASARQFAFGAPEVASYERVGARGRRQEKAPRRVSIRAQVLHMADSQRQNRAVGPARTLIAAFTEGQKEPLVLLASRELTTPAEVLRFFSTYPRRWCVELAIRVSKSRNWGLGFEDTRVLSWRGTQQVAFLACVYLTFLAELGYANSAATEKILAEVNTCASAPEDLRYRLAVGMRRHLTRRLDDARRQRSRENRPKRRGRRAWMDLGYPQT